MADAVSVLEIADTSGVKYVAKLSSLSLARESLVRKLRRNNETFMTADGNEKLQE